MAEVLPGRSEGEIDAAMEGLGYSYYHLTGPGPIEPAERVVGRRGGADVRPRLRLLRAGERLRGDRNPLPQPCL